MILSDVELELVLQCVTNVEILLMLYCNFVLESVQYGA